MKLSLSRRSNWPFLAAIIAIALTFSAPNAARAFTFEGQSGTNSDYRSFTDLQLLGQPNADPKSSQFDGRDGAFKNGSTSLQFGSPQTFDQRYNPSSLFDPFAREGR